MSQPMKTKLETAIEMLFEVYDEYSITEGNEKTLTKEGMKTMVEKELPGMMAIGTTFALLQSSGTSPIFQDFSKILNAKKKDDLGKLLKHLDENGVSEVDFKEYIEILTAVLIKA
ncbi:protein S100-P-like [Dendrobates tinctorius]|uniref:protein S100-P-like n=1 Tax=Dendrobates tinctorius TaxID=92724 RepID=UPI003CC968F1